MQRRSECGFVFPFLNRDGHDRYRYLRSVRQCLQDLDVYRGAQRRWRVQLARLLPEMTDYGAAQLTSAKFFGPLVWIAPAMLKHANRYGLKSISFTSVL